MINPQKIYKVTYESDRISLTRILEEYYSCYKRFLKNELDDTKEINYYNTLLIQQFFLKSQSWAHENEYRIIKEFRGGKGAEGSVREAGLNVKQIVAGINCTKENVCKLKTIAEELSCQPTKQMRLSESRYFEMEEI